MPNNIENAERLIKEGLKELPSFDFLNARAKLQGALLELKKEAKPLTSGEVTLILDCLQKHEGARLSGWSGYENLLEKLRLML